MDLMASEGLTRGGIIENEREKIKLAQLHGDLDAIGIIQERAVYSLSFVSFEGKKHLWNMLSRLTKRVDDVILKDGAMVREVIHLAAKGRKQ